jgi:hypothetical protein
LENLLQSNALNGAKGSDFRITLNPLIARRYRNEIATSNHNLGAINFDHTFSMSFGKFLVMILELI